MSNNLSHHKIWDIILILFVCIVAGFAGGNTFPPHPPFFTLCRAFISRGLRPYRPRRRTLSSLLVRLRRPTLHRPLRGLRQRAFAPLRSPSSHLLLAARFGCRRTVQSVHIRCAAHTALFRRAAMLFRFTYPLLCAIAVILRHIHKSSSRVNLFFIRFPPCMI